MAELVNLRTARKRAKRRDDDVVAGANRLAHGQPAAERKRDAAQREKNSRALDQHRIEPGSKK
jgi:hypothetical protein